MSRSLPPQTGQTTEEQTHECEQEKWAQILVLQGQESPWQQEHSTSYIRSASCKPFLLLATKHNSSPASAKLTSYINAGLQNKCWCFIANAILGYCTCIYIVKLKPVFYAKHLVKMKKWFRKRQVVMSQDGGCNWLIRFNLSPAPDDPQWCLSCYRTMASSWCNIRMWQQV